VVFWLCCCTNCC